MPEEYYSAKEAMEVLKKPSTTFYREVKEGRIPYKGKKRNMLFPKAAIDALAEVGAEANEITTLSFLPSTVADLWTGIEITQQLYGDEDSVPFKKLLEWQKANEDIYMSLKEGEELVGAITFLPLDEKVAIALIHNEIKERDIPAKAIKKWADRKLSVYIPTIEVVPSGSVHKDKERASFLLRRTIKWAILLTVQHDVKNWYAVGATPEGQAVLETLGFKEVTNFDEGTRKGYILETILEPVKLVSRFIEDMGGKERLLLPEKSEDAR